MITFDGGKAIASGGYGCVFQPALKCKGKPRIKNGVSKLMLKNEAEEEFEEIQTVKSLLNKIPNYKKYFLLDGFSLCEPDDLTESDKIKINQVCDNFPLKATQVLSKHFDKLFILNMPYGGIRVKTFILETTNYKKFIDFNNHLIQLLLFGVVPMNHKNVYHSDIKESNVLILQKASRIQFMRLIDWGITCSLSQDYNIPDSWKNRSLHFNMPFSVVMFRDDFIDSFKKNRNSNLNLFVKNYILNLIKESEGHIETINHYIFLLFQDENIDKKFIFEKKTIDIITNYIVEVLENFSENNDFDFKNYIKNVYSQIVDIWGLLTCYFPFISIYGEQYFALNNTEKLVFQQIKEIIFQFMFLPRSKPIDLQDLKNKMKNLNFIFSGKAKKTKKFITIKNKTLKNKILSQHTPTLKNI
jgi:hypothetical protein